MPVAAPPFTIPPEPNPKAPTTATTDDTMPSVTSATSFAILGQFMILRVLN